MAKDILDCIVIDCTASNLFCGSSFMPIVIAASIAICCCLPSLSSHLNFLWIPSNIIHGCPFGHLFVSRGSCNDHYQLRWMSAEKTDINSATHFFWFIAFFAFWLSIVKLRAASFLTDASKRMICGEYYIIRHPEWVGDAIHASSLYIYDSSVIFLLMNFRIGTLPVTSTFESNTWSTLALFAMMKYCNCSSCCRVVVLSVVGVYKITRLVLLVEWE